MSNWLRVNGLLLPIARSRIAAVALVFSLAFVVDFSPSSIGGMFAVSTANAQTLKLTPPTDSEADGQMLLEADDVTYDNDNQVVTATGNVQIVYNTYTLVAKQVRYDRRSGRVIASGSVEIHEPNGNVIHAEEIDVTDDFSNGFVSALNIETPDRTHIAAESAERKDGQLTEITNGAYTACEPCRNIKGNPPFWQVRARKITIDNKTRTVKYQDATFELFGKPIAYLPYFSHADPGIKRHSGFLLPSVSHATELGYFAKQSYFINLAPSYDMTLSGGYFTEQGFLGEAEWRQRLENGKYRLRIAGIDQKKRENFSSSTVDHEQNSRFAVTSDGDFQINSRWKFGWDWLYQTDENFSRTYDINGYSDRDINNSVYLTGIGDKNFFDLRAQQFLVQDNIRDIDHTISGNQTYTDQQGVALPSMDYNAVSSQDVFAGQLAFDANVTNILRHHGQVLQNSGYDARNHGLEGDYVRATAHAEWKKAAIIGNGLMVTVAASGQADSINFNPNNSKYAALDDTNTITSDESPLTMQKSMVRAMPAGMMEIRYPMVANTSMATHIFEPIAQIIVRPNETHIGRFPNEDAQSMVFDTANLFKMNKFSGYDRIEGGTRANVGFRYSASFENGDSLNVIAGQSYQVGGKNSYAQRDLVNAGLESGLETTRSDYVGSLSYLVASGWSFNGFGRFDESDFELRRAESGIGYLSPNLSFNVSYIYTDAQPQYSVSQNRHEIRGGASIRLTDQWRAFGAISYDIENKSVTSESVGLGYDNECISFSIAYADVKDRYFGTETGQQVTFNIGLRTIGNYGYSHDFLAEEQLAKP